VVWSRHSSGREENQVKQNKDLNLFHLLWTGLFSCIGSELFSSEPEKAFAVKVLWRYIKSFSAENANFVQEKVSFIKKTHPNQQQTRLNLDTAFHKQPTQ